MNRFLSLFLALAVLFINSCNDKNKVNLVQTNAEGQVASLGNLQFVFDKNLVGDSLLEEWDNTEYIKFDPPIVGKFRWANVNELVFSPENDLPPATNFKATITKEILKHTKFSLGNCEVKKFFTAPLSINATNAIWNINDGNTSNAFPQVDIEFNYAVSPDKLKPLLTIEVDGEAKNYNIQTTNADQKITISVMNVKPEDKDRVIQIKIAKGLLPLKGNNPTTEDLASKNMLISPYRLIITSSEANHDGTQGTVKIFTSQTALSENLKDFISIAPAVNFRATISDDAILVSSDEFDVAKSYNITVKTGLKGKIGGTLREDYSTSVAFGQLEPQVQFVNRKGLYLSSQNAKNIEVSIVSVDKVKITISKIYENNLLAADRYGYYPEGIYDNEYEDEYSNEYYGENTVLGDVIYQKVIETKSLPKYANSRLFKFNIEDKLKDLKGIYHVRIQSTEDYWRYDQRFVSLSDIGLIAKETEDKLYVFTNSISKAESMSGVNINVVGSNNQNIGSGTTDGSGVAVIDLKKRAFSGFTAAMITAKSGSDFNYLPLRSTRVETSRFDVGGKRNNITGLDVFIYSERDIYRPGEKINMSAIVRDWEWKKPGEVPMKIKLLLPNGKELKTVKRTLNSEGSLEAQFDLSPSAVSGSYTFEVYSTNDILLATKSVLIEEFMPDRIKVEAKLDKENLLPGDITNLNITATNFFGPPAANRNYELEIQLKEKYFSPKKYSRYNFMLSDRNAYYDNIVREGQTDENGKAVESFTAPKEYLNRGLMQADFFTTVFDETGRPVNRKTTATIFTQDVFYGISNDGYYYYALNQNVKFPIIALDKKEQPIAAKARVQVIKHDYKTVLSRNYEYFRYESQRDDKVLIDQEVNVSGENSSYSFVPRTSGQYEIRIGKPGVNSYVSYNFYSYGWGGGSSNFEVNNEGNIDIETDKEKYFTGEGAKVLFKTPFNGKMLVTVENNKIIEHQYINVDNRTASIQLKLKSEHLPNAYITATLIKPHQESDMPLTVAHGFQSVTVENKERKMNVEIIAAKSVRSRTHQKVKIKAAPNSKVTLAAVDEGILQVTGFTTPDPYNFFYAKRALGVASYDLYPLLFPEIKGNLSSTGGDGFDLSKRTNPMQNKRVKLVSYWSGITDANGNGEANFEFDIPQFSGELRLMAVGYKNQSFGSSEARMTVADPIVVSTALPRFLSPKDTVLVPVTVTNTTAKSANASATIKVSGPLKVVGNISQTTSLKPNSEARLIFSIVADSKIDAGKVTVEINSMGEKFIEETDITVRPPSSLQKITDAGAIAAGSSKAINFSLSNFISGSTSYQLIVSKNPALEVADQMYSLVNYPYGCTEQTISAAFPQLYFSDLADQMKMNGSIKTNANQNVQEAIRKIKMRQLYNGAITLWDSEGSEHWWSSVYAAHFLLEAKKAGFDVEQSLLDNLFSYLTNRLKNKESITYYYNENQKKQIAPKEVAYSLYVLALAGKQQAATMNYYKQNSQLLSLDSRYLLSAAFALAGDRAKYNQLLPGSFSGEVAKRETGGSFGSDLRDEAIALNAVLEVDAANPQIGTMAKHISQELRKRKYLSTQERAFGFLAIGKIARQANNSTVNATIKVGGKTVAQNDGSTLRLSAKELGGANVDISVTGNGKLYYFWQAEGISADGSYKEEDSYIKVRKRFYDRYGRELSGSSFKQNDLVVVAITLENSYSQSIENIVITDLLPAGFEIENPRTKEIPGMNWIKNDFQPTHLDVRDDRINFFVDLYNRPQTYYYAVRAVSPGTYRMGPVMADAMYNGEYHSYHGAKTITVNEK